MQLKCPKCQATFESEIQLPRDVYERSALEGNSQPCEACGEEVVLSEETVFFTEPEDTMDGRTSV
jgi:NAD-dependent SIR2 family protein deacetylase